jgi:hypothetical protein
VRPEGLGNGNKLCGLCSTEVKVSSSATIVRTFRTAGKTGLEIILILKASTLAVRPTEPAIKLRLF